MWLSASVPSFLVKSLNVTEIKIVIIMVKDIFIGVVSHWFNSRPGQIGHVGGANDLQPLQRLFGTVLAQR